MSWTPPLQFGLNIIIAIHFPNCLIFKTWFLCKIKKIIHVLQWLSWVRNDHMIWCMFTRSSEGSTEKLWRGQFTPSGGQCDKPDKGSGSESYTCMYSCHGRSEAAWYRILQVEVFHLSDTCSWIAKPSRLKQLFWLLLGYLSVRGCLSPLSEGLVEVFIVCHTELSGLKIITS